MFQARNAASESLNETGKVEKLTSKIRHSTNSTGKPIFTTRTTTNTRIQLYIQSPANNSIILEVTFSFILIFENFFGTDILAKIRFQLLVFCSLSLRRCACDNSITQEF